MFGTAEDALQMRFMREADGNSLEDECKDKQVEASVCKDWTDGTFQVEAGEDEADQRVHERLHEKGDEECLCGKQDTSESVENAQH